MQSTEVQAVVVVDSGSGLKSRVCVLGAGCIGLSTAVALGETLQALELSAHVDICVISDKAASESTSIVSAGAWSPFNIQTVPPERGVKWSKHTRQYLEQLCRAPESAAPTGITPCTMINATHQSESDMAHTLDLIRQHHYVPMSADELASYADPSLVFGYSWQTLYCDQTYYLPWLEEKCKAMGIQQCRRFVAKLDDLSPEFDAIINCTGLGSRALCGDSEMQSVRGQVIRVKAPWIKQIHCVNMPKVFTYIVPQRDCVVLGGVKQVGDWSTEVREEDSASILQRCCKIHPDLSQAPTVDVQVGLRPQRLFGVRLEVESIAIAQPMESSCSTTGNEDSDAGKPSELFLVHNYGHGSCGITMHWGCAEEAAGLMCQWLAKRCRSLTST